MATFSNKDFDSTLYHAYRPVYHQGTYELIYDYHEKKGGQFDAAADVGTGTGQAAAKLADKFKNVVGTDISEKMLEAVDTKPNLRFQACPAEKLPFADDSLDLVSTFEAMHYFKRDEYFKEVQRVLKPNGTIAIVVYHLPFAKGMPEVSQAIDKLIYEKLTDSWDEGRFLVDNLYRDITFPFDNVTRYFRPDNKVEECPGITSPYPILEQDMTLKHFELYCKTWSGYAKHMKNHTEDPVDSTIKEISDILNSKSLDSTTLTLVWPSSIILGTKK
ncbi:hypothetical protein VKS41_001346 [Umbelopsis sp. WA50703]